jgi:hypothetical protein
MKENTERFDLKVIMTFQLHHLMDGNIISASKKYVAFPNILVLSCQEKNVLLQGNSPYCHLQGHLAFFKLIFKTSVPSFRPHIKDPTHPRCQDNLE